MDIKRIKQVVEYGWKHAGSEVVKYSGKSRIEIFVDILQCFRKYRMWSNQYVKERFWEVSNEERDIVGKKYLDAGIERDAWQDDFRRTRTFLIKYSNIKYEKASLRSKRNTAYTKHYNAGKGLVVENNVNVSRQHYLNGTITIGDNVLLAKNVFIDYSGTVIIGNNVKFSNGAVLESHTHAGFSDPSVETSYAIPKKVEICDNVKVGTNSIILDSCPVIGRRAIIGAGSVIRSSVPPYAIVSGNPAKVIGFIMTPNEIVEFEKTKYKEEERLSLELLEKNYNRYFLKRIKEIKEFIKL